jgi:hypothetical protein
MEPRYGTPEELVEALQMSAPGARAQLWQVLGEAVDRLMGELIRRHALDDDHDTLTRHALHSAETSLRMRPASSFRDVGWTTFRATVLVQLARIVHQPHGGAGPASRSGLPSAPAYHSDTFSRPYTRMGGHFFGGDWYAGRTLDDGSFWVLVADVTGHGYFAYLLASSLPAVWQRCWNAQIGPPVADAPGSPQPAELLAAMHELLADCLPEGIFLECTLVRLDETGRATVSPAGGSRLLVGKQRRPPDLVKLRGAWLGLRAPSTDEQHTLELGLGDELILATDGVFDQLDDDDWATLNTAPGAVEQSLFERLRQRLETCLENAPQRDDITLVLLRRREPVAGPVLLSLPLPGARLGVDDVPV